MTTELKAGMLELKQLSSTSRITSSQFPFCRQGLSPSGEDLSDACLRRASCCP